MFSMFIFIYIHVYIYMLQIFKDQYRYIISYGSRLLVDPIWWRPPTSDLLLVVHLSTTGHLGRRTEHMLRQVC